MKGLKRKKGEKWGPLLDDDFEIVMRDEYSKSVVPDVDMEKIVRQSMEDGRNTILPTGYESIHEMLPMDFEEYLWAIGISHEQTGKIREHIHEREPFDEGIEHYPLFAAAFMDSMYDLKNIEYRKDLKLNL